MKIDGKLIAKELKSLRIKNGYTIEDICNNISLNTSTAYKYERNADNMQLKILTKYLDFYKIDEVIFFKMIGAYNHTEGE